MPNQGPAPWSLAAQPACASSRLDATIQWLVGKACFDCNAYVSLGFFVTTAIDAALR